MAAALYVFIGSVLGFLSLSFLVAQERRRGGRFFLEKARYWADRRIENGLVRLAAMWEHFVHYIVKLGWYYSLHSLLRTILRLLVAAYDYLEGHFETNRFRARTLQEKRKAKVASGGHLQAVAEHKADVALSPDEVARMKEEKLEERD